MLNIRYSSKYKLCFGGVFRRFVLTWILGVTVEYLRLPPELRCLSNLEGMASASLWRVVVFTIVGGVCLCVLGFFADTEKYERWGIWGGFGVLSLFSSLATHSLAFGGTCALIWCVLGVYVVWGRSDHINFLRPKRPWLCITAVMVVVFFLFMSVWTVARVRSFSTPTYDFGIFSQMFFNMKKLGVPVTTLERDGILSHFAVHISPIYYLMLPIYVIFPRAETLQVLQAAVVASAVIPTWKLCRTRGFSDFASMLVCAILILLPAFSGGIAYDLHENCFLTPLILWIFYGIEKKNQTLIFIFSLLTLLVKEDAAVYVCVIGLWLLVTALVGGTSWMKKSVTVSTLLIAVSLVYFLAVTTYLSVKGDGVMSYRYENFMYDGSGSLLTVVKSVILNPMKAVYECVDGEKLKYITLTLLPLAGLPLITAKYERYILLIPYLLVNLMSDYQYQHDIFFQYSFGSTAFLMYLLIVNIADIRNIKGRTVYLLGAAAVAAICFFSNNIPKAFLYADRVISNAEEYIQMRNILDRVPENASVAATTFYTTYLSSREIIYDVGYCSRQHLFESEYIVVDPSDGNSMKKFADGNGGNGLKNFEVLLCENGYEIFDTYGDRVVIYFKTE